MDDDADLAVVVPDLWPAERYVTTTPARSTG
jgi:hypothetical protein